MSFNERSIDFNHPSARPPRDSLARGALDQLYKDDYAIVLNPTTDDPLVEAYIDHEIRSTDVHSSLSPAVDREIYKHIREQEPQMNLALLSHMGKLVGALTVQPRGSRGLLPDVPANVSSELKYYDYDFPSAGRFVQVVHSYAHRKLWFAMQNDILIPVASPQLVPICKSIGYEPVGRYISDQSRIAGMNMVVSSERLTSFNVGKPKPRLSLIRGGKDNMGD